MSAIYIHIPYCRKACNYCNFHFSTTLHSMQDMVDAMVREIELRKDYLSGPLESIYFGGGTPSILSEKQLAQIFASIRTHFSITPTAEITLEANPDDVSESKLAFWKTLGVNRFSLGVQSFAQEDLQWMNRAHTAAESLACIKMVQAAGFDNFTIDLIYGSPTLSDEQWFKNVQTAIELNIPHISCYALTVEKGTALDKLIAKKQLENTDPDKQARHFEMLMQWLRAAGYDHYEVSNFGKPGFHSRHNSSYWQGKYYLGIGPSAHSFNGVSRQWNISNNVKYINSLRKDTVPFEIEQLSPTQRLNEYIMTSLRTMEGLDLDFVEKHWNLAARKKLLQHSQKFQEFKLMDIKDGKMQLTDKGFLLADGIAADLFE